MAIFVTIYNYRAHNYFITIVMKFCKYFPSSIYYIIYYIIYFLRLKYLYILNCHIK